MEQFDLIVLGAGPGGYTAALEAAKLGKTVALVERKDLGGTCLNRGCIPTKALLRAASVYRGARDGEALGVRVGDLVCDTAAMYQHVGQVTATLRDGIAALLQRGKVKVLVGTGRIEQSNLVSVDGCEYGADRILVAVGSRPSLPPIPGLDLPGVVTSDGLLAGEGADAKRLVIIGGGVIGAEFAQIFSDLGREVTILEALPRMLANMDRELAQNLNMIFKKRGIAVHTGAAVTGITREKDGLLCHYTEKDAAAEVPADCVLVCTGRRPETEQLFAPNLAVETLRGYLPVNGDFETAIPGVYAVGDVVAGGIQLAHAAENQAKNAVRAMFGAVPGKELSLIPGCVYTDPEIASVGLTADDAKGAGRAVRVQKSLTSANGKALVEGAERGFSKLVFDGESGKLLGAQLMCPHAAEMIGGLTAAIAAGLTEAQLARAIYPHPSVSEILNVE
ncbi:MAG: dihydrolipoyl dehydrogenase [Pseudoflavonifractor sp.]